MKITVECDCGNKVIYEPRETGFAGYLYPDDYSKGSLSGSDDGRADFRCNNCGKFMEVR